MASEGSNISEKELPITSIEARRIAAHIAPVFSQVLSEYDFRRYPAAEYLRFKAGFSALRPTNLDIKDAMVWKWGHWGKPNYPDRQKQLINEIQQYWTDFISSRAAASSKETFNWWRETLGRQTTYITVSYISHLIHHAEPLPIIDQHNFRAMNWLILLVKPNASRKKKPSNWNDIMELKSFMNTLIKEIPGYDFSQLDRFLMMYGRNHVPR